MINANSNISAMQVITAFNDSQKNLSKAVHRLSTGFRVNSSKDDPSGVGVSMRLNSQIARKNVVFDEVNNAISLLDTQDAVMKVADSVLQRMSELTQLGVNTLDTNAQALYQLEYVELEEEIHDLLSEQFNGQKLFASGGSSLTVYTSDNITQTASVTLANMEDLVFDVINGGSVTSTATYAAVETAIENLGKMRTTNGSEQNRLERSASLLNAGIFNLTVADGRIMDADIAQETVNMTKYDILHQSGLAMLVQANQSNENILTLLR